MHSNGTEAAAKRLRLAYAIQNVGGIDFSTDVGDTVPVKHTLRGLAAAGHEVTCLTLNGAGVDRIDDMADLGRRRPVPLGVTGTKPYRFVEGGVRHLQRQLGLPYFAFFDSHRFYAACRRLLPDYSLCHEHNGMFSVGAALACWRADVPYVLTVSADPFVERSLMGRPLRGVHGAVAAREARFTYRLAQKIICVSEPARRNLVENWRVDPEKVVVLPNGVDAELFRPVEDGAAVREQLKLGRGPVVAFVGAFHPWHGLDRLIDSFAPVVREMPAARLLLIGDGRARPQVDQKIKENRLEGAVNITGLVPQQRIPQLLGAADVAVLPYPELPQEMWFSPLKLYEYMAAGKAIVASRSGQIAEVIEHGWDGVLVEPGDVRALSDALLGLLGDDDQRARLGRRARQAAVERHSWQQYIRQLEDVYAHVLSS